MTSEEYEVKLAENSISFGEKLILLGIVAMFVYVPNIDLSSKSYIDQISIAFSVLIIMGLGTYMRISGLKTLRELRDKKS